LIDVAPAVYLTVLILVLVGFLLWGSRNIQQ
jgi:hypothetical protein